MASTAYRDTGARLYLSGYTITLDGRVNYNTPTRLNNTVSFTGVSATVRYGGVYFTWYPGWDIQAMVPNNSGRSSGYWSGTRNPGNTNTTGEQSFSVSVGSNDNSISVRTRAKFRDDGWSYSSSVSIPIPTTSAPSGTTYFSSRTDTSISVRNDVTHWGNNVTAGSVRSYRADNSGFSGQTYIGTTDNAVVNHTGLSPNTRYWFRGWADNGGGKSDYMSTINEATLANATETSKDVQATAADFVLAVAQGYRTTEAIVQYRKLGDTTWLDSSVGAGGTPTIGVSGLLPSTEYEYRLAVTTTDGTWTGSTSTFTTLPAAKLVMPDGTVKNAIPHIISPDGSEEMVKVKVM